MRRQGSDCAASSATSWRRVAWWASLPHRSCRGPRLASWRSSATRTRTVRTATAARPILDELAWGAHAGEAGRMAPPEPLFPRLDVETDQT